VARRSRIDFCQVRQQNPVDLQNAQGMPVDLGVLRIDDDFEGAESEVVVNAEHSEIHRHPLSVLEVYRILLAHLAEVDARPPSHLERLPYTASTASVSPQYAAPGEAGPPPVVNTEGRPAQYVPPAVAPPQAAQPTYLDGPPLP